ncbi:50S ribosomal protein L18 [Candidatus Gottesmanbacteria bacterium]|nr:50S ribosomal protein L18 [Candidatus Gottesmanbacteria bacterium]
MIKRYKDARKKRHTRIRVKFAGTKERPRLSVFRSNRYIYAQIIDDETRTTLASIHTKTLGFKGKGIDKAQAAGQELAKRAKKQGIIRVVFDRGGYRYHGQVKAVADSARKEGLKF